MSLLAYIVSLALGFCLNNAQELQTIKNITYLYENASPVEEAAGIDYVIKEIFLFKDGDGNITTREEKYKIPFLNDVAPDQWHDVVEQLAEMRGITIKGFSDDGMSASGIIQEERLAAMLDASDGWVTDFDSFDYLDQRELEEQQARYVAAFCSFGLFYMSAKMLNIIFAYWLKPKKKGV